MAKTPTGLTGASGEYYVAAELSRRNWLATVTIKNAPGTDVLAQHLGDGRTIAIQAKTANPGPSHFQVRKKDELPSDPGANEWYVFVGLGALGTRPDFYVVPRDVVAAVTYLEHREWLRLKGYKESPTPMRTIRRSWIEPYRESWELLVDEAPSTCLLHETFFTAAERFGWPAGLSGLKRAKQRPTGGPLDIRVRPS